MFAAGRWRRDTPRGGHAVSLSRVWIVRSTKEKYVLILSDNVNCRNYEYYTIYNISIYYNMDLSMYSNVYEDWVVNPRRDKSWIVL